MGNQKDQGKVERIYHKHHKKVDNGKYFLEKLQANAFQKRKNEVE